MKLLYDRVAMNESCLHRIWCVRGHCTVIWYMRGIYIYTDTKRKKKLTGTWRRKAEIVEI